MLIMNKILKYLILPVFFIQLLGCATYSNPDDPYESYNRGMYEFNDVLDKAILKPVASGYKFVTPDFAEKGVNNFFNNVRDFMTAVNDLLQLEFENAVNDTGRVILNSTVGIAGLVDVHTMVGGDRRKEDFGTTLASYGWENSNYLVLPLFGPSTIRDGAGLVVDAVFIDPIGYINDVSFRNGLRVTQIVDARSELLDTTSILDEASFDPYSFQRDSYMQYRDALINENHEINYDEYMDVVELENNETMAIKIKEASNKNIANEINEKNLKISETISSIGNYLKEILSIRSDSQTID